MFSKFFRTCAAPRKSSILRLSTIATVFIFNLLLSPTSNGQDVANLLQGMEGWTIIAITQVDGDFEGCDFNRPIRFINGMILECSTYSYTYAFMPDAVIFSKSEDISGHMYYQIKVLIDDDLYDMEPIKK